jgi:hypothetical protein
LKGPKGPKGLKGRYERPVMKHGMPHKTSVI